MVIHMVAPVMDLQHYLPISVSWFCSSIFSGVTYTKPGHFGEARHESNGPVVSDLVID